MKKVLLIALLCAASTLIYLVHGAKKVPLTQQDKQLLAASAQGDYWTVYKLVNEGANVNAVDADRRTPLINAAKTQSVSTMTFLYNKGARLNAVDMNGWTPVHHAAKNGIVPMVTFLAAKGADLNANKASMTVKVGGVRSHKIEKVTPLHVAAEYGNDRAVSVLFERGARVNVQDSDGNTPLHLAARADYQNIHDKPYLPTVKALVIFGKADHFIRNNRGSRPRDLARRFDRPEILEFLRGL